MYILFMVPFAYTANFTITVEGLDYPRRASRLIKRMYIKE